jgi:hypothetical protein
MVTIRTKKNTTQENNIIFMFDHVGWIVRRKKYVDFSQCSFTWGQILDFQKSHFLEMWY